MNEYRKKPQPSQTSPFMENLIVLLKIISFTVICGVCLSIAQLATSTPSNEEKDIKKVAPGGNVKPKPAPLLPPFCLTSPQLGRPCMIMDEYGQVIEVGVVNCNQDKTDLVCQTTFPLATTQKKCASQLHTNLKLGGGFFIFNLLLELALEYNKIAKSSKKKS